MNDFIKVEQAEMVFSTKKGRFHALREIDPATVVGEYDYAHPVFDLAAIRAQQRMANLQGQHHTWFAGAWLGYGFHEDGLKAGLRAAQEMVMALDLLPARAHAEKAGSTPAGVPA